MLASTFFDGAVVHVLTTATLDRLRELNPQCRFEVRRFRPNIVIELASGEKSFVENAWLGHTVALGGEVRLKVTRPCPRCVMATWPQGDLPKDPGILRTAAQHNQANVGVYTSVSRGGWICRGDPVRLEERQARQRASPAALPLGGQRCSRGVGEQGWLSAPDRFPARRARGGTRPPARRFELRRACPA